MLNFLKKNFEIWFFLFISIFVVFWPVFINGKIPFPGDILLGNYHPWKDVVWSNKVTGYPVKNFELSDVLTQYYPFKKETITQIKNGQLPITNPYIFSGTPLLADGHSGVLYPLNIIFWLSNNFNFNWSIFIMIQPLLAGLFFYLFLRSTKLNKISSVFGSLIFSFNSYFFNQVEFGTVMHTILWIPLSFYALNKLEKKPKFALLLSFSLSMSFLAGFIQFFIYHFILVFGYYIFLIKNKSKNWKYFLFSLSFFVIISLPQIIPWLKLLPKTSRWQGIGLDEKMADYLIDIKLLLTSIIPDFFGSPSRMNWFGNNHRYYEFVFYSGCFSIIPMFFCSFKNRFNKFFGLFLLFSLILCTNTPLTQFLYFLKIPIFSSLNPARILLFTVMSISFMSASGLNFLMKQNLSLKKIIFILFAILILPFLYWYFFINDPIQKIISLRNSIIPIFLILVSMFILIIYSKLKLKFLVWIILIVNTLSLLYQGFKFNSFISPKLIFPETNITLFLKNNLSEEENILTIHPEVFPVNVNMVYKFKTPNGYHPVQLADYNHRLSKLQNPDENNWSFGRTIFLTKITKENIDKTKVGYILTLDDLKYPFLKKVFTEGKTNVYKYIK